jgi:hypothetical protein
VTFESSFETGLSGHPGKAAKGLEDKARGKMTVVKKFPPPAVFASYLCHGRLQEQRRKQGNKQWGDSTSQVHSVLEGCQFGSAVHPSPPSGWQLVQSRSTGKQYYFNPDTGESRWKPPADYDEMVPTTRPLTAPLQGVGETRDGYPVFYGGRDALRSVRNMKRGALRSD